MANTKIEWTLTKNQDGTITKGKVWNPTVGCTKVSEGCRNCYAERIFNRFNPDKKFSDVRCYPGRLEQPLHWTKPRRVFVDSMSDLFHPEVPNTFIDQVFWIMMMAPIHTFLILTKRPKRMMEWVNKDYQCPLSNVWLGVSVEDQATADERIPILLKTPAAVRFVSVEPMLGEVDLDKHELLCETWSKGGLTIGIYLDWVICGCESGPNRRQMELDWARSLRNQCQDSGVPFFLKQAEINGKVVKMPELDGKIWNEYPEV